MWGLFRLCYTQSHDKVCTGLDLHPFQGDLSLRLNPFHSKVFFCKDRPMLLLLHLQPLQCVFLFMSFPGFHFPGAVERFLFMWYLVLAWCFLLHLQEPNLRCHVKMIQYIFLLLFFMFHKFRVFWLCIYISQGCTVKSAKRMKLSWSMMTIIS